jgi:hypothetical protein
MPLLPCCPHHRPRARHRHPLTHPFIFRRKTVFCNTSSVQVYGVDFSLFSYPNTLHCAHSMIGHPYPPTPPLSLPHLLHVHGNLLSSSHFRYSTLTISIFALSFLYLYPYPRYHHISLPPSLPSTSPSVRHLPLHKVLPPPTYYILSISRLVPAYPSLSEKHVGWEPVGMPSFLLECSHSTLPNCEGLQLCSDQLPTRHWRFSRVILATSTGMA